MANFDKTPLPNPQFYILLCIRFIEPISFSLLFPFVYFMVKDFNLTDDASMISYYAGMISSSYAVGEFLGGVPWGMLSDRIGRKPVITLGLLGTSVSLFMFGLSQSLPWAMTTRFMGGILNGNVGVIKSMVGEMTDRTNRADAFSYLSMMLGLGFIVGPIFGGFLTHPTENFPWLFGDNQFLKTHPYFLPCGVTASLCLIGFVFAHVFLQETLQRPPPTGVSIVTPLLGASPAEQKPDTKLSDMTKGTWLVIASCMGTCLIQVMCEELFPFWASTAVKDGGLGFNSSDIGMLGSIMGAVLVLIQMFVFVKLKERFGTLNLLCGGYLLYVPLYFCMPLVRTVLVGNHLQLAWALLLLLNAIKTFCSVLGFTTTNILLPESCPNKATLGTINGISNSLASLMRGIGPYICGVVYSWSLSSNLPFPLDYHFTFFLISGLGLATFFIARQITPAMISY
ncbi:hypothetical protein DSO57_1031170 [Entomophthora muscae]|uniref:Uncharacterized protein n=1 Tax=Entomophthora muscae TaxID=34485 RepID=A0ACC2S2T8_9FUNG|nr:hypothetical protein DSO57_1031170 [Entomophthora muscae]